MRYVTSALRVIGGISFALVLVLAYVVAPIGLLALVSQSMMQSGSSSPVATASMVSYGATGIVVAALALATIKFLKR